ncbi:hypothetical protein [Actinokineospora pegani]|uniref:hypothetical protein n=1 Tax=Actinokineospora pegani TaxID=2654637 RepID=UPI0012EABED2|nr:hypothetical protein [Actinokineospora pegani]
MPSIQVSDSDLARLTLLARAWQTTESDVVRRLLDDFSRPSPATAEHPDAPPTSHVPIFALYQGHRIEAVYDRATKRVEITSGPLKGQAFKSPSGAAISAVQSINPTVHPNRNGWGFWFLRDGGKALNTIRYSHDS